MVGAVTDPRRPSDFHLSSFSLGTAGPYPWSNSRQLAESGPYGFYLDSYSFRGNEFGKTREPEMTSVLTLDEGNRWKTAPIGGEAPIKASGRNRNRVTPGIFKSTETRLYMYRCIRYSHNSWLGSCEGEQLSGGSREVIHKFHKAMGYRFELKESTYGHHAAPDHHMVFGFVVRNSGSAPFLYDWPVMISLCGENRKVLWRKKFPVDIRNWLPGSDFDLQSGRYGEPPLDYHERARFDMSNVADIPAGVYTICMSIEDPAPPSKAAVRFANENYWQGGLHPVGRVAWKLEVSAFEYAEPDFGELFTDPVDNTLGYSA